MKMRNERDCEGGRKQLYNPLKKKRNKRNKNEKEQERQTELIIVGMMKEL
jgi:hypothetical protein